MKVYVYKRKAGKSLVVVVPHKSKHMPPIQHPGTDRDEVMDAVAHTIAALSLGGPQTVPS